MYQKCILCARKCGVNRSIGELGFCNMGATPYLARAAAHMWEEPIISGNRGSGTLFFSGCSLGCVFCQNREISSCAVGYPVDTERIAEIMLELEASGVHNVNFVTPTHFAPHVASSVTLARSRGFSLPTVYNTGSYDTIETLKMLEGLIDVYLPDFKYYRERTAKNYSSAPDYPDVAASAIAEMVRQRPRPVIKDGLIKSGVVVRVLLLPEHLAEAKLTVKYLLDTYGDSIYISLMNQYTPMAGMKPPLDRRVTHAEYDELVDYAISRGLVNGFTQDFGTAEESFIPPFDATGVLKTKDDRI